MARRIIPLLAAGVAAALCAAPAAYGEPRRRHPRLRGRRHPERSLLELDLRKARDSLPSDLDEYSDCREVIGAAIGGSGASAAAAVGALPPGAGGSRR